MPTRSDHFIRATLFKGRSPDFVPGFAFLFKETFPLTDPTPIRQKQIRLAWNVVGRKNAEGKTITAGQWHPDTPTFRDMLRVVMEAGVEAYGAHSHWIEEWTSSGRMASRPELAGHLKPAGSAIAGAHGAPMLQREVRTQRCGPCSRTRNTGRQRYGSHRMLAQSCADVSTLHGPPPSPMRVIFARRLTGC